MCGAVALGPFLGGPVAACVRARWSNASRSRSRLTCRPAGRRRGQREPGEGDRHAVPLAHLEKEREGLELPDRRLRRGHNSPSARCSRPCASRGGCGDRFDTARTSCRLAVLQLGNTKVQATVRRLAFPAARSHLVCVGPGVPRWLGSGSGCRPVPDRPDDGRLPPARVDSPRPPRLRRSHRRRWRRHKRRATAPGPQRAPRSPQLARTAHTRLGTVGYRAIGTRPPLLLTATAER